MNLQDLLQPTNVALAEYSAAIIVVNIIASFLLSLIIVWAYQRTHKGVSYSQSFVTSLVMMSVLSAIAMMILGNNLIRALGILGVFTLLRFRTIIKDTRDATYLFFALAMGMAIGTNNYIIASLGTVLLSGINLLLARFNVGAVVREGYLFTIIADKDVQEEKIQAAFADFVHRTRLLQVRTSGKRDVEYYYALKLKDADLQPAFVQAVQSIEGVQMADLSTSRDAAEY